MSHRSVWRSSPFRVVWLHAGVALALILLAVAVQVAGSPGTGARPAASRRASPG